MIYSLTLIVNNEAMDEQVNFVPGVGIFCKFSGGLNYLSAFSSTNKLAAD